MLKVVWQLSILIYRFFPDSCSCMERFIFQLLIRLYVLFRVRRFQKISETGTGTAGSVPGPVSKNEKKRFSVQFQKYVWNRFWNRYLVLVEQLATIIFLLEISIFHFSRIFIYPSFLKGNFPERRTKKKKDERIMTVTQLYNLFVNKEPSIFIKKNFLCTSNIAIQNIQD
jgi:hypothetical protein